MKPEIKKKIKKIDIKDWKKISIEFGQNVLEIAVPPNCAELSMKVVSPLTDPRTQIEKVLSNPIHSPTLEEIVRKKTKKPEELTAAITVSDVTRPVPYKGDHGILTPVLRRL
jgi:nickel-dependent lactate racemase